MNARTTALSALIAMRRQNAWADGALKDYTARDRLDRRDAALAARLLYGVVQNRMLLDFYLAQAVASPLTKLQPVVLDILRLGAYQILFLDKIPVSAAVNEAVEQTKTYANKRAAGLVNGSLRTLPAERTSWKSRTIWPRNTLTRSRSSTACVRPWTRKRSKPSSPPTTTFPKRRFRQIP